MRRAALLALALAGASGCKHAAPGGRAPASPSAVPLVAVAELHGTTEPCGCNSDPLGDLARVVRLAHGGLLLDAGDALYDPAAADHRGQADLKAEAIAGVYARNAAEAALGPADLIAGVERVGLPRQACNVSLGEPAMAPPRVREVRGLRVGVFGAADPARIDAAMDKLRWRGRPPPAEDPIPAARAAVAALAADRAEVVVALLAMTRTDARKLVAAVPGIDFAIVGLEVGEGMVEPEPVGDGWLLAPADQGRRAARLEIVRGAAPAGTRLRPARFDGEAGRARGLERLDRRIAALREQLAAWRGDKTADATFVAAREAELAAQGAARAELAAAATPAPSPPYFTYSLVPVRRALPRDPDVVAKLQALDRAIGKSNLEAAQKEAPPAPAKDRPSYVGGAACVRCHKAAAAFWDKTRHAQAWKTLVDVDKQYNYDCTGCHVTGWMEPGGVHLASAEPRGLVNVQCEVCHGPGSRHVEEAGLDDPKTMKPGPEADLCRARCHTKEHSDTFALEPYLRDVLGPGHGEKRRKALGDGPTGHELRQKALAAPRP